MSRVFARPANAVGYSTGRPLTFVLCCLLVVVWAATEPMLGFSDAWQLVIDTAPTIITFLIVFLIQNTQNCEGAAQAKLDEIIRVLAAAENRFIGLKQRDEEQITALRARYAELMSDSGNVRPTGIGGATRAGRSWPMGTAHAVNTIVSIEAGTWIA